MNNAKVLCVYGAKGGIGKTTITLNLAGVIAGSLKNVLIIDLDLTGGDIAVSLDKAPSKTIYDLNQDLNNEKYQDLNNYLTKYNKYISFIAAPSDPREGTKINLETIERIITDAKAIFDVILLDTNHVFSDLNLKAMRLANQILFLTTNNPLDLKNARNTLAVLKEEKVKNIKVLLNNSIHPNNNYFVLYDIKNIIQNNIDYHISSQFHYKDIDSVTVNGEILTLKSPKWPDYKIFTLIIESLLK